MYSNLCMSINSSLAFKSNAQEQEIFLFWNWKIVLTKCSVLLRYIALSVSNAADIKLKVGQDYHLVNNTMTSYEIESWLPPGLNCWWVIIIIVFYLTIFFPHVLLILLGHCILVNQNPGANEVCLGYAKDELSVVCQHCSSTRFPRIELEKHHFHRLKYTVHL